MILSNRHKFKINNIIIDKDSKFKAKQKLNKIHLVEVDENNNFVTKGGKYIILTIMQFKSDIFNTTFFRLD